jgi:hypothetical protein
MALRQILQYLQFSSKTRQVNLQVVQNRGKAEVQGDQKSLSTWWLQYRKLPVMFKLSSASLQTFIDTRLTLTPSAFPNSNYVIMVSDGIFKNIFARFCTVIIRYTDTFWSPCINLLTIDPCCLPPRTPCVHCIGDWVGPKPALNGREKSRPLTRIRCPNGPANIQSIYRTVLCRPTYSLT